METRRPKATVKSFAEKYDLPRFEAKSLITELKLLDIDPFAGKNWAVDAEVIANTRTYLYGEVSQPASHLDLVKTFSALAWDCVIEVYNGQKDYRIEDFSLIYELWGEARIVASKLVNRVDSGIRREYIKYLPLECRSIINTALYEFIEKETPYGMIQYQEMFTKVLGLPEDTETKLSSTQN